MPPKTNYSNTLSLWSEPVETARLLDLPLDDFDDSEWLACSLIATKTTTNDVLNISVKYQ